MGTSNSIKSLIAMSFIVLSYTVLSKTDLVLWMLHLLNVCGLCRHWFYVLYETRSEGLHYILYAF